MNCRTLLTSFSAAVLIPVLAAQDTMTFAQTTARAASRISFWGKDFTPLGQACIQYAQPTWKDEYDAAADKAKGKHLRLGSDFWTTLDSNSDLTIGDVAVPAGQWYLGLHCSEKGEWSLLVIDPSAVRAKKLDAFQTSMAEAKFTAPLTHGKLEKAVDKLTIELLEVKDKLGAATLSLTWGKHQLSAPVTIALAKPPAKEPAKEANGKKDEAAGEHGDAKKK